MRSHSYVSAKDAVAKRVKAVKTARINADLRISGLLLLEKLRILDNRRSGVNRINIGDRLKEFLEPLGDQNSSRTFCAHSARQSVIPVTCERELELAKTCRVASGRRCGCLN